MAIRILIADDHGVVREGLGVLLDAEPGVDVVGIVPSAEEALRQAVALQPDLVFMDISLPEMGGIEATRRIRAEAPDVRVLVLTVHEDKAVLREAVRVGAAGYLLKQAIKDELIHAIHTVMRGELYVHPVMTRVLMSDLLQQGSGPDKSDGDEEPELSPREVDVLRLLAQGYTNRQAADRLAISVRTVEYHRANIAKKLQVSGRVGLVRYAEEHGIL